MKIACNFSPAVIIYREKIQGEPMKKPLKKIPKTAELMWVLGIFLVALGVTMSKKADLGVSMIAAPTFIVYEAIRPLWAVSVGTVEYLVQGVILLIMCAVVQRVNWRYLLAFAVAVIYGYVMDMWMLVFKNVVLTEAYLKWIMLIAGDVMTAAGVACFFRTYMPLQVHELFVAELSDRYSLKINRVKLVFDLSFLVLSVVLALTIFRDANTFDWKNIASTSYHSLGLGTIVTTLINAPIIAVIGKGLDKVFDYTPLFPKLEKLIGRKKKTDAPTETEQNTPKNEQNPPSDEQAANDEKE